jgi:hypothetical protein
VESHLWQADVDALPLFQAASSECSSRRLLHRYALDVFKFQRPAFLFHEDTDMMYKCSTLVGDLWFCACFAWWCSKWMLHVSKRHMVLDTYCAFMPPDTLRSAFIKYSCASPTGCFCAPPPLTRPFRSAHSGCCIVAKCSHGVGHTNCIHVT